jgi:hypothetical protein
MLQLANARLRAQFFLKAVDRQDHPDFRAGGKIFVTLGYPERGWALVKLAPEQQPTSSRPIRPPLSQPRARGAAVAPPACV